MNNCTNTYRVNKLINVGSFENVKHKFSVKLLLIAFDFKTTFSNRISSHLIK